MLQIGNGLPNLPPYGQSVLLLRVLVIPTLFSLLFSIASKLLLLSSFSNARLCESCEGCLHRSECHTSKFDRRIRVSHKLNEQNRKAREMITTEQGILLRMNRSIQVEGAFGVIKQDFRFKRFLTRGKSKTETQFFLIAFAYNAENLCNKFNFNRFGRSLLEKMIA